MAGRVNASNPSELRREAERALLNGYPVAPAVLNAITLTDRADFGYDLTCEVPGCNPAATNEPCLPALTLDSKVVGMTLRGWQTQWTRPRHQ